MRHKAIIAALLVLTLPVAAQTAHPSASALLMAVRLQSLSGGVSVVLRLYGDGLAGKAGSPNDYRTAFAQAMTENQQLIGETDARMAALYAGIYPAPVMEAQLDFYDSPVGRTLADRYRNGAGQIIWPGAEDSFLSKEESAALKAFNNNVRLLGDAAQKNPDVMDGVLAAETDAIIKLRLAANAKYCQTHDCAKEGIK